MLEQNSYFDNLARPKISTSFNPPLKEEYHGKGYGSEFLEAFVQYWSSLPRKQGT
ncbi:hypothetical protein GGR58DRAFT_481823 [Xylaria digitata]|nr:hypothetical protein GGR58DRAFT_481823 [Xylaria digitata]